MKLASHVRTLWPRHPLLPAIPLVAWAVFMAALGRLRIDHVLAAVLVPVLAYSSRWTKRLLVAFSGFLGVAVLYDAMRFVQNVGLTPSRVLNCDLHAFELRWFGFDVGGVRYTLHDWFFAHHALWADVFFSIPYATFLFLTVGYALYLFVVDERAAARFGWTFFLLNIVGFLTYHIVPAAPPWYTHTHGCTVDLATRASRGAALARVDEWLHFAYFQGFYGRSSDVFGAIPSLHVAYPLMIVWEARRRQGWVALVLALCYWVWMSMAAVYLDHHWITDIVLGWAYALGAMWLMKRVMPLPSERVTQTAGMPAGAPAAVGAELRARQEPSMSAPSRQGELGD